LLPGKLSSGPSLLVLPVSSFKNFSNMIGVFLPSRETQTGEIGTADKCCVRQKGEVVNRARILLADDHDKMRDRVKRHLEHEFEVLGSVEDGFALLEAAARLKPDVCLLDISMPLLNGIETATRLIKSGSTAKIVFLTIHEDLDFVQAALKTGASGYVIKRQMVSDLRLAIKEALAGRIFISTSIAFGVKLDQHGESPP
jgi:DNA-binding NarL/FixJ family response regulator